MTKVDRENAYIQTFEVQRALRNLAKSIPGMKVLFVMAEKLSEPVIVLADDNPERVD